MYRDVLGFSIAPHMSRIMTINGCYASIMRADKKSGENIDGLPLGVPIPVLAIDYLKSRPEHWIGGEGSYVCPVDSDWGLWFNFTMNNYNEMAILTSVKGMNPLTGQRLSSYNLEDFQEECPIHKVRFSVDKLCPECGFKWPSQNYLSYPNPFYIDGFRTPDGNVRQFYFTEDASKSIPEQVIGKDDTVPAFGFCFYHLKEMSKQKAGGLHAKGEYPTNRSYKYENFSDTEERVLRGGGGNKKDFLTKKYRGSLGSLSCASASATPLSVGASSDFFSASDTSERSFSAHRDGGEISAYYCPSERSSMFVSDRSIEVGLGAGEKIKQDFVKANKAIEEYKDKPSGVIRLYFVFQEEFEKYVSRGLKDLKGSSEGYLTGLPVGAKS